MTRLNDLYFIIKHYIEASWNSESRYLVFGLLAIILVLIVGVSVVIISRIHFKDTISRTRKMILMGYKRLDERAKTQLVSRLRMSSEESDFRVKLGFFEAIDLRLIERSNIRSYIPILNVYVLLILITAIFLVLLGPVYSLFNSWKTTFVVSLFISLIPAVLLDSLTVYNASKTRKITANFLSLLLSWLEVKNDLIFAFERVADDIEAPLRFYLIDSVAQLKSGIDAEQVFDILSYKINTEHFYTITKNFKSVFKNGGDVIGLVKVLEDEAYMIDNEFETRVTDTFTTRMLLNLLLLGASFFLVGALLLDPTLKELYTTTEGGKNIMFFATIIFVAGFLWNLKSGSSEF